MLLHYIPMLTDFLTIDPNMNVAIFSNDALFSLKKTLTFAGTKIIGGVYIPLLSRKFFFALATFQRDTSIFNLMGKVASAGTKPASRVSDTALLGERHPTPIAGKRCSFGGVLALNTAKVSCLVSPFSLKGVTAIVTGKRNHNLLQKKTPFVGQTDVLAEGTLTANKGRTKKHIRFSVFRQYSSLSRCNYITNGDILQVVSSWVAYKLAQSRKLYRMQVW